MSEQQRGLQNQSEPPMDFGGEVYYAFGWLPENARRNAEIRQRAIERARVKMTQPE